ncbi:hypothetical protein [Litorivivens sp.]|uniref:hypothetical protein n=1 Tax=Litorivivens sp. TaxID=2020868 RepID=UPI003567201B
MAQAAAPLAAAGTALNVAGTIKAGRDAYKNAKREATDLRAAGKEAEALATRNIQEMKAGGEGFLSDMTAAQVGTGGAIDAQAIRDRAKAEAKITGNILAELFSGQSKRKGLEREAAMRVKEGKAAKRAAYLQAAGTALSGASKYASFGG